DELMRVERHDAVADLTVAPVIFPFESDTFAIEGDESGIGDGDAMSVASKIGEYLVRTGEGTLGVDHPFHTAQRLEEGPECIGIMKRGLFAEKLQRAFGVGGDKTLAHEAAKQSREHFYAEKVPSSTGYPALSVRRDAAARHNAMHVGM